MTVDLADQSAEDAEEVVLAWLTPLRRAGVERLAGDVLPFTLVVHVAGSENIDEGTAAPIVSVHTLVARSVGLTGLKNEARATHQRMLRLATHCDTITLVGGRKVGVDYVDVVDSPFRLFYDDDQILRKVGRYEIGLTYVPA